MSADSVPAQAYVEQVVRASGTSFYWAMRFLPPEKRAAMLAVYAFCREVDDVADEPGDVDAKRRALAEWREEIEALFRGAPRQPVTAALSPAVSGFALRKADFLAIIDGMEMDAAERIRIADLDELRLYCDRVACAVGRLSVRIFGVGDPLGDQLATTLGHALQLTNILRDVKEDASRDRLYLPHDLLTKRGIDAGPDVLAILHNSGVASVCADLAGMAVKHFDEAAACIDRCERRQVRPATVMMHVYQRTLSRLIHRGWRRWAEPVSLSSAEKLWIALRYGMI
ncbi:MAG: presqualene diphosphate synthase HpnD [Rhodospirillales bacterium]|nr:presqualene diphosphate synthase HpnD [Rhodospirillales bacterium]